MVEGLRFLREDDDVDEMRNELEGNNSSRQCPPLYISKARYHKCLPLLLGPRSWAYESGFLQLGMIHCFTKRVISGGGIEAYKTLHVSS